MKGVGKMCIDYSKYFYYDESSPSCLRWKVEVRRGKGREVVCVSKGDAVGYLGTNGYWVCGLNKKILRVHRIIYMLCNSVNLEKSTHVDHIDGNKQNNTIANLRAVSNSVNRRNMSKSRCNMSGVTGVSFKEAKGYANWRANWHDLDGKRHDRSFSVIKYGYDMAFKMACDYREQKLKEMNENGAGYTERHGK